jgi:hypothetical protein
VTRLPNIEGLDPGIREVVALLRVNGFETTDSGDGRTKIGNPAWNQECLLDIPHVFMLTTPDRLVQEADRLADLIAARGVEVGTARVWIEATYSPRDRKGKRAILGLLGLDDAGLAKARVSP